MRFVLVALLTLATSAPALAAEKRPRGEQDECSRKMSVCEKECDDTHSSGMDRLSCKTDCRLAESECRNSGKK